MMYEQNVEKQPPRLTKALTCLSCTTPGCIHRTNPPQNYYCALYTQEIPKATTMIRCEVCDEPIDIHYGEVTLGIQPHVIRDGTFWNIDQYRYDSQKKSMVCEKCIIKIKDAFCGYNFTTVSNRILLRIAVQNIKSSLKSLVWRLNPLRK